MATRPARSTRPFCRHPVVDLLLQHRQRQGARVQHLLLEFADIECLAQRSGFGPGAAKAGHRAILTGQRSLDKDQLALKAETITVGGTTYDVYPQRPKSLKPAG